MLRVTSVQDENESKINGESPARWENSRELPKIFTFMKINQASFHTVVDFLNKIASKLESNEEWEGDGVLIRLAFNEVKIVIQCSLWYMH